MVHEWNSEQSQSLKSRSLQLHLSWKLKINATEFLSMATQRFIPELV